MLVILCSTWFCIVLCFFFFKQKTAYEMRISDWSSDVCSSDLPSTSPCTGEYPRRGKPTNGKFRGDRPTDWSGGRLPEPDARAPPRAKDEGATAAPHHPNGRRSEERRVGKECDSPRRSLWSTLH